METDMDYIGVIGNFKGNVIFCRFLSWFLFYEYLIYLNAVISKAAGGS